MVRKQVTCSRLFLVVLSCIIASGVCEMVAKCPPDYVMRGGTPECYLFNSWTSRTFDDAKNYCSREDGILVSIHTEDLNDWLALQIGSLGVVGESGSFWINARYNTTKDKWIWGDTGEPVDQAILPIDGDKQGNSGTLTMDSTLKGEQSASQYPFICYKSIDEPMFCDYNEGWHLGNDRCYSSPDISASWTDAVIKCSQISGYIITINGEREQGYAYDEALRHHDNIWIGMNELSHPNNYTWFGDDSGDYLHWNKNLSMPISQAGIGSAVIDQEDPAGFWVTEFSTNEHHYVCEKSKGACVVGWELFQDSCYYFNALQSDDVTWNTANDACSGTGAHLLIIDTAEEDQFIKEHLEEKYQMWIGLYATKENKEFRWVDGRVYSSSNFSKMTPDDENAALESGQNRCVYTHVLDPGTPDSSVNWLPVDCSEQNKYVCEVPKGTEVHMPLPPTDEYCPSGWELSSGFCYYSSAVECSWTAAEHDCKKNASHLTSVLSWPELDHITSVMQADSWIGLNDLGDELHFEWVDGSAITMQNWADDEPSGQQENCVEMWLDGKWNDVHCSKLRAYVCKQQSSASPFEPITTTTEAPDSIACGHEWTEDPLTGTCYKIIDKKLTSYDASLYCQELSYTDGQSKPGLVSLSVIQEQIFVQSLISKAHLEDTAIHIGLINDYLEMSLYWRDHTAVSFMNWADNEPNGANIDECVEIYNDGRYYWNDVDCNQRRAFVCEKKGMNYVPPTPPPASDDECPEDWDFFNQHCYYVSTESDLVTWEEGKSRCTEMYDSTMVSITNEEENMLLYYNIMGGGVALWIGLYADGPDNTYVEWIDGTPLYYSNWYIGEPSSLDELCVEIMLPMYSYEGEWNDQQCANKNRFACKMTLKTCPQSWQFWEGKCYYISDNSQTWNNSLAKCKEVEGDATLLSWHSQEEQDYVLNLIDDSISMTWFGLYRSDSNASWTWTDGTDTDYVNWRPGQPNNNETEFCALALAGPQDVDYGTIDNYPCDSSFNFVCQFIPTHYVGCLDGWSAFEGSCYYNTADDGDSDTATAEESRQRCLDMGADLVSIFSQTENEFVGSLVPSEAGYIAYIGLTAASEDGQLKWVDGSSVIYTNLAMISMPSAGVICYAIGIVESEAVYTWKVVSCSEPAYSICKMAQSAIPVNPPSTGCLNDDLLHEGSCYRMVKREASFADSKSNCSQEASDSHLVTIKDQTENAFLSSHYGELGSKVWIGLKQQSNPDGSVQYNWIDETEFTFDNWGKFEPMSSRGSCVYASGESTYPGVWYVVDCGDKFPYICEYARTGYTSDAPPVTTPRPAQCTPGWTHNTETQTCYKLMPTGGLTQGLAQQECMQYDGGNLVSIGSEQEKEFIVGLPDMINMTYTTLWTGLMLGPDDEYAWLDGTPTNYLTWAEDQPDSHNGIENCVTGNKNNMQLSDTYCDGIFNFMCEAPQGISASTAPPVTLPPDIPCPGAPGDDGWLLSGEHCYKVFSQTEVSPRSWTNARKFCQGAGAELVSVLNQDENSFLLSLVHGYSDSLVWIGAYADYDRSFYWSDGEPMNFVNWAVGEPNDNNDQEDCVSIYLKNLAFWNDDNCGFEFGWVCKMPSGSTLPPPPTTEPPVGHCPPGWRHAGSRCVKLFTERVVTFENARHTCKESGVDADLVSIHGTEMQAAITAMVNPMEVTSWIGLKKNSLFLWVDQSPVDYTNWAVGEPNNNAENEGCVEMIYNDGSWNDADCNLNRTFICAQNVDPNISTGSPPTMCTSPYNLYVNYSGGCYKAVNDPKTWEEAESYCAEEGTHLASVENIAENSFLYASAVDSSMSNSWLGLNSIKEVDHYTWSDGFPVLYTNWGNNEPNITDPTLRCVALLVAKAGSWYNKPCDVNKSFFCKHSEEMMPTPGPPIDGKCPSASWLDFGGGHCYFVETEMRKTWSEANLVCSQEGGNLASIHSADEMNLIVKATAGYPNNMWIGLIQQSDDYGWSDNSALDFFSWAENEPNNDNEPCVEMISGDRMWNDVSCDVTRAFVCKAPKVGGTQTDPVTDPPATTTPPPTAGSEIPGGLTGGAIAGIIISVLLLFAVVGVVLFHYRDRVTPLISRITANRTQQPS